MVELMLLIILGLHLIGNLLLVVSLWGFEVLLRLGVFVWLSSCLLLDLLRRETNGQGHAQELCLTLNIHRIGSKFLSRIALPHLHWLLLRQ